MTDENFPKASTMIWEMLAPGVTAETLGIIPYFLDPNDPRPAVLQFDANYSHGGGWRSTHGFTMLPNGDLSYPGDPPTQLLAQTRLRHELIRFYDFAWVAVIQPDGSFVVCRMD